VREAVWVPRDQVIKCLRERGWSFKRQTKRVEIYKLKGETDRLPIDKRKSFPENYVRTVLAQAGLNPAEIEQFLKESVKDDGKH